MSGWTCENCGVFVAYSNLLHSCQRGAFNMPNGYSAPLYGFKFLPEHCEHCWCIDNDCYLREGHHQCCNCGAQKVTE
jgi:hypothetical protein